MPLSVLDASLLLVAIGGVTVLLSRRVRDDPRWRATVTPLASIIGSGFLVVVPLLAHDFGPWAPLGMAAVVVVAWCVGAALRFNIVHLEPLLQREGEAPRGIFVAERVADVALGISYLISVTFYLRLLAAFLWVSVGVQSEAASNAVATALLVLIGAVGWRGGLRWLERLEEVSVSFKLAVIAAMLLGWAVHDVQGAHVSASSAWPQGVRQGRDPWEDFRLLAGMLLVVQGFETSRYLGSEYPPQLRVRTMRVAQLVAALIYLSFVALTVPSYGSLPARVDETAIVQLSAQVARVLPPLLILAAAMSQFSAAVADTLGAGGLFEQLVRRRTRLRERHGYVAVALGGTVLVWSANIFEIVALASRAFAFYYAAQCILAASVARGSLRRPGLAVGFGALAALMLAVTVFAVPVG